MIAQVPADLQVKIRKRRQVIRCDRIQAAFGAIVGCIPWHICMQTIVDDI